MQLLVSNNARSTLESDLLSSATTMNVAVGTGSKFPVPVPGVSYFLITLTDVTTGQVREIVRVTEVDGDLFTIVRAQEGTDAVTWAANDICACLFTAGSFEALSQVEQSESYTDQLRTDLATAAALKGSYQVAHLSPLAGAVAETVGSFINRVAVPVTRFGAKGDGTTDDSDAINAAINATIPNGYSLYFPDGTYLISKPLVINPYWSRYRIYGNGSTSKIRTTDDVSIFSWSALPATYIGLVYASIDNLSLSGSSATGIKPLIDTANVSSLNIHHLLIEDLHTNGNGISVRGNPVDNTSSHDIQINDIYFNTTTGDTAIYCSESSADSIIDRIWIEGRFGLNKGVYFYNTGQWQLSNSHIYNTIDNVLKIESATGVICLTNMVVDNSQTANAVVYLKNTSNVVFMGGKVMFARENNILLELDNSYDNRFIGVNFEASGGSEVTGKAVVEINGSDRNTFIGTLINGTFSGSPTVTLTGINSVFAPIGRTESLPLFNTSSISSSGTLPLSPFGVSTAGMTAYIVTSPGYFRSVSVQSTVAPGTSQQYAVEVKINGTVVATGNINGTGTSVSVLSTNGLKLVAPGDSITVNMYSSSGAATAYIKGTIRMDY